MAQSKQKPKKQPKPDAGAVVQKKPRPEAPAPVAGKRRTSGKNLFFFYVFALVWVALTVFNMVMPAQSFSEAENRPLASWPNFSVGRLLDGEYAEDINIYLNDHFVGKNIWIGGQAVMEFSLGKREINGVLVGRDALFTRYAPPDDAIAAANLEGINRYAAAYDMPVSLMLVPSAASVQPQLLPARVQVWDENAFVADMYGGLSGGIVPVDVSRALLGHAEDYIFYRTDHHWTTYGAFLGYQAWCAANGRPVPMASEFDIDTVSRNFLGTLDSRSGFRFITPDEIERYQRGEATSFTVFNGVEEVTYDSIFFEDFLARKDQYSFFLGQVQPCVTIKTGAGTGKSLIIFKDSYAHCLTPMLLSEYDEIRLVDLRYINGLDIALEMEADRYDEAMFLFSADVFAHSQVTSKFAKNA